MIIYSNTVSNFNKDVFNGLIANKLEELFIRFNIGKESSGEYRSWMSSLEVMSNVLMYANIDKAVNVAIEYQIPLTSKRVDFLISGLDAKDKEKILAIELKQWSKVETASLEDCVKVFGVTDNEVRVHPSQQIYSYCQLISNFNKSVQEDGIELVPCAFLHNYPNKDSYILEDEMYKKIVSVAPCFYQNDRENLANFIGKHICKPAKRNLFEVIDNGKLKPSKALQDAILPMVQGNEEFVMIDEQQVAYATITKIVRDKLKTGKKYTIIVKGGPGTGKSVIAVQALAKLNSEGFATAYMTKNSAPRQVFKIKLTEGHLTQKYIGDLLRSPQGLEYCATLNKFPCIIVDEAHRLTTHYGHNQIDDIIRCSQINVFFIDEDQKVTTKDIGTIDTIYQYARKYNSTVICNKDLELKSQFRCNGSDGYLAFLDNVLEIRETPNTSLDGLDYDFRVFDSPTEMRNELAKLNKVNNKSRLLAGYCYEWVSENNTVLQDIIFDDGFFAQWNLRNGQPFAISDTSFEQVGCIHTCQGLEFDYVGVIIGQDLTYEDGKLLTHPDKIAKSDKSSGIRSCKDKELAAKLIKNTYKTLLSRGQKGCFVYCENAQLKEYLRKAISKLN